MTHWFSHARARKSGAQTWPSAGSLESSAVPLEPVPPQLQGDKRFIARQSILDKAKTVFGYELLARSGWENRFTGSSDDATRKMISDGALYGCEALTYGKPAFINCTRESLVEGLVTLLPKTAVLEILETVLPDQAVISACRELKSMGYQIALDDFRSTPATNGLVEIADYIKVDFRLSDASERKDLFAYLGNRNIKLIAEKIETEEEFSTAVSEGFDLFQGYFFCQPTVFTVQRPPSSGRNYFPLLAALSEQTCDLVRVGSLLKTEPAICYQLLRLVNSASYASVARVESLQHALMLVGETQFRKIVLNAIAVEACGERPRALLVRALLRARFMELMAPFTGQDPQEQYLYGLLTLIDVLLQIPASALVDTLQLRPEVKDALNGKFNEVSTARRLLSFYEEGSWNECLQICERLAISEEKLVSVYTSSLQWAEQVTLPEDQSVQ